MFVWRLGFNVNASSVALSGEAIAANIEWLQKDRRQLLRPYN